MVCYCVLEPVALLYMRISGSVDVAEIFETYRRIKSDPKYNPSMKKLTDSREMMDLKADGGTTAAIKSLADMNADQNQSNDPPLKVVLVNSALIHGLARQYETLAKGLANETMTICETERAALSVLGRDEPSIDVLLDRFSTENVVAGD